VLAELGVPIDEAQEQQDAKENRDGYRLLGGRCPDFPRTKVVVLWIAHVPSRLRRAIMTDRLHLQQWQRPGGGGIQAASLT